MSLPWIVWLGVQVVSLSAYAGLVLNGHGWWAVPLLVLASERIRE